MVNHIIITILFSSKSKICQTQKSDIKKKQKTITTLKVIKKNKIKKIIK